MDLSSASLLVKKQVPLRTIHIGEKATNNGSDHTDLPMGTASLRERIGKQRVKEIEPRLCEGKRTKAPDVEWPGQVTPSWTKQFGTFASLLYMGPG